MPQKTRNLSSIKWSFRIAGENSLGIFTGFRFSASVAQLAEQRFCKPPVVGSNPSAGSSVGLVL